MKKLVLVVTVLMSTVMYADKRDACCGTSSSCTTECGAPTNERVVVLDTGTIDDGLETRAKQKQVPGLPDDAELIDGIQVVMYSEEGTDIITKSDGDRPSIEGTFRSLDDILFERLVYLDAQKFKIVPGEEEIEKHLKSVQRENNMTQEQLKNIFKSAGYTWDEGKEQFRIMTTVGYMLEHKIRSRLLVPERDVVAYYEAHPERQPAAYLIERAFIPFSAGASKRSLRRDLEEFAQGERSIEGISWNDPFWIEVADLADDKRFIMEMKKGQISMPIETATGYELFSLKDTRPERLVPLELRYRDIANLLRKPRYDSLMNEYKKQLLDTASIVYF